MTPIDRYFLRVLDTRSWWVEVTAARYQEISNWYGVFEGSIAFCHLAMVGRITRDGTLPSDGHPVTELPTPAPYPPIGYDDDGQEDIEHETEDPPNPEG